MATGGWGAAGAWGTPHTASTPDPDLDDAPFQPSPLYNTQQPAPAASKAPWFGQQGQQAQPQQSSFNNKFQPSAPPAAYADTNTTYGAGGNLAAREAELNKKAAELAEKEKKLNALEQELKESGGLKKKNWPLWPKLIYHDIAADIPDQSKRVVREIYACWYGLIVCLIFNFFCASVILGTGAGQKIPSWFLAIIYAVLGIPLSFWMWYLRIYRAARDDSKLGYLVFFFFFGVHIAFCIWASIAVPFSAEAWSFAGWVTAMGALGEGVFPGIVYIIGASLWTLESVYSLWCAKDAYLFFRGKGGVAKAKEEAAVAAFMQQGMPQQQQHQGTQQV